MKKPYALNDPHRIGHVSDIALASRIGLSANKVDLDLALPAGKVKAAG